MAQRYSNRQNSRQVVIATRPTLRRYDDSNLQVQLPPRPWMEVDASQHQPGQTLMLVRNNPNIMVLISGESIGVEAKLSEEELLEIAKSNLVRQRPDVVFVSERRESVNGVPGTAYEASLENGERSEYWVHWVGSRNGYIYQLDVAGQPRHQRQIRNVSRYFQQRMRQIDSRRVAHLEAGKVALEYHSRFQSAGFGYEVDLTGKGWTKWNSMQMTVLGGEFGAEHRRTGAVMVVLPVPMPGRESDLEVLTKSLLLRVGLEYPDNCIQSVESCEMGALRGQRIRAQMTVAGNARNYDFRVVADQHAAYLIGGWTEGTRSTHERALHDALNSVRITTRELPPERELPELRKRVIGLILNDIGAAEYGRGDYVAAIDFFRSAAAYFPENETIVSNHLELLSQLDRSMEALSILQQREVFTPSSVPLRALKARLLCHISEFESARAVYAELFADGCTDEALLLQYLSLALEAAAFDEAITVVEAVKSRKPTLDVQRCCARLYGLKGDFAKSIALLQALRSKHPADRGIARDLASVYEQAERYSEAITITQRMLDADEQDEETLVLHGRIQLRLEEFGKAKQTFEQALSLNPHSEVAGEGLRIASSLLGEGDNSALKTPLRPVEIPQVVQDAISKVAGGSSSDIEEYGAEEVLRVTGIYFKHGEPLRRTTTRRIKLHTAGGVSRFRTLTFGFNPTTERVYVNRLVVLDEQGKQVTEGSLASYYIVDDTSSDMASSKKLVKVPVPGLKPGYTLECTVTREDQYPAKEFAFREVVFSSSIPVRTGAFFVRGDVQQLKFATSLPMKVEVAKKALFCVQANPAPYRYEANQPSLDSFLPIVWLGPSDATWEAEALEYLARIGHSLEPDEDTRALAHRVAQDCTTKREKLAAIVDHVQRAYTYQAIEFGRRACIPNSAATTHHLKYGDCKDHAVLVKQLLEVLGIESHLALVKSSGRLVQDLPSLDQFDHMIVFVPAAAIDEPANEMSGLVIDATEKDADAFLSPPWGMAEKSVLVLDPADPRIIRTPGYPAEAGQLLARRQIEICVNEYTGHCDAHVQETVTFNSYLAPGMRAYLKRFEPGERRQAIQELLAEDGQLRVKRLEVENLEAPMQPLCLTLDYKVPDVFHSIAILNEKSLVGRLPCPWERRYLEAEYLEARGTPFEIRIPTVVQSSLRINLPAGYQPVGLERANGSGRSDFIAWQCHARHDEATVCMDHQFRLLAGRYPAEAYDQYFSAIKQSLSAIQAPISLREAKFQTANRPEPEHSAR